MADRPIIFSAPMVRALLDGRKSQTRRVLKKPAAMNALAVFGPAFLLLPGNVDLVGYAAGDRLWVREGFVRYHDLDDNDMRVGPLKTAYRADGNFRWLDADTDTFRDCPPWKPSIHMPRWASRLTLIVTEVRAQRLQEISAADAKAEGVVHNNVVDRLASAPLWSVPGTGAGGRHAIAAFAALWASLHGPEAWDANPWVAAISFTVHRSNIDAMEAPHA